MKNVFIWACLLFSISASAQKISAAKVPNVVTTAFTKLFPGINDAKWELEKGTYEANFSKAGLKSAATFNKAGNLIETEHDITIDKLPAEARSYVDRNLKGKKIKSASIIELASGVTNYEANVGNTDYLFDGTGKFLRTKKD